MIEYFSLEKSYLVLVFSAHILLIYPKTRYNYNLLTRRVNNEVLFDDFPKENPYFEVQKEFKSQFNIIINYSY